MFGWCSGNQVVTVFFFNDTATTEIYTLSLHDALPISEVDGFTTFAIHDSLGFTQDDCDDSTQLDSYLTSKIGRAHV